MKVKLFKKNQELFNKLLNQYEQEIGDLFYNNKFSKKTTLKYYKKIKKCYLSNNIWKEIKEQNFKSTVLYGEQGIGKTYFAKKIVNLAKADKYKIIYIKAWDYDYENKPFLLILKKIYNEEFLNTHEQRKLHLFILLYENQKELFISQHILIDIIKRFLLSCKSKHKFLIVIDELDRCKPFFAIELLEIVTTFLGIEMHMDKNNFNNFNFNDQSLFINKSKILWVVNRDVLNNFITKTYNLHYLTGYWNRFFEFQIKLARQSIKTIFEIIYDLLNIENYNFSLFDCFLQKHKINIEWESIRPRANMRNIFLHKFDVKKIKLIIDDFKKLIKRDPLFFKTKKIMFFYSIFYFVYKKIIVSVFGIKNIDYLIEEIKKKISNNFKINIHSLDKLEIMLDKIFEKENISFTRRKTII